MHISEIGAEDSSSDNSSATKKESEELYRSGLKRNDDSTILEIDGCFGSLKMEHKLFPHMRNHSVESINSDISSIKGSEISNLSRSNSLGDMYAYFRKAPGSMDLEWTKDNFVSNTVEQRKKLSKLIISMQQGLVTAQTDMEDLIARLNQEIADKEYFKAKVKDLEMELESVKKTCKDDYQKAILVDREKLAQIQWDAAELQRKYATLESSLKLKENEKACVEMDCTNLRTEKELLLHELDNKTEQLKKLQMHQEEFEIKSKSDIRALVKEVKSLRTSQAELKEAFSDLEKEKNSLERFIESEKQRKRHNNMARKKVIYACEDIQQRLQESSVNFLVEEEEKFTVDSTSLLDALGLLNTSDTRIGILLSKAQLISDVDKIEKIFELDNDSAKDLNSISDDEVLLDDEIRKLLSNTIIDCAVLRKQINSVLRTALKTIIKPLKESNKEGHPRSAFLQKIFRR